MPKDKIYISQLIGGLTARKILGELLPDEEERLGQLLEDHPSYLPIYEELLKADHEQTLENFSSRHDAHRAYKRLMERQPAQKPALQRHMVGVAAAILVFLSIGIGIYWYGTQSGLQTQPQLTSRYGEDVLSGGNHALLTLADGRTIWLDSAANGLLMEQAGVVIRKNDDGLITYEVSSDAGNRAGALAYHTITTPKGGQYKVILPDGSQVWLNAASSLTYPTQFSGSDRMVELTGEAYFDVVHNAQLPFIVVSQGQRVQVMGTQFNVQAYPDEPAIFTTLVEGGVAVTNNRSGYMMKLSSGQQSILQGTVSQVLDVDVGSFTAWKDNYFQYDGADMITVMRELERWYDIEIDHSQVPAGKLYARVSRDKKLSDMLYIIETSAGMTFKVKERRLTIQK